MAGKSMEKFVEILKFNAKSAEGGDLVAANIAASPFQNVGKLIKFSILGRKMLSKGYYDDIVEQYKGLSKDLTPRERATKIGFIIRQSVNQLVKLARRIKRSRKPSIGCVRKHRSNTNIVSVKRSSNTYFRSNKTKY